MALSRRSGGRIETNTWPGFVDAMTALLLILMFVMSIFMILQFTMSEKITGQSRELDSLTSQLAGLADVLSLERDRAAALESEVGELQSNLTSQRSETDRLTAALSAMTRRAEGSQAEVDRLNSAMAALVQSRDLAEARSAELETTLTEAVSEREALAAALASTRTEMDAAVETARLAAARREAMEALIADLRARNEGREAELAAASAELAAISADRASALALIEQFRAEQAERDAERTATESELAKIEAERTAALALIAQLEGDNAALTAVQAALEADKAALEADRAALGEDNRTLEEQRREVEALRAAALERLSEVETRLTAEEEARLLETAAAEALKHKLETSETELDAMTLALEQARKEAEQTLILLAAAEAAKQTLESEKLTLEGEKQTLEAEKEALEGDKRALEGEKLALEADLTAGGETVDRELALRRLAESELAKVEAQTLEEQKRVALLNAQVRELREQLGGLQTLLEESETRDADAQVQIARLGERLNAALAQKVGELARFRSVFFEKMEQVLGGRQDIQRVGDRFVFQSEVLFAPGSADLGPEGQAELAKLGEVLRAVVREMPGDLNWILRVDGHTDKTPLAGHGRYRNNWELSQGRALSVVRYLIEHENVPPERLSANGFGEFQPIDDGETTEALARNRRIEFKFTER